MTSPQDTSTEIRTRDGVRLFHRDWGQGRPVVFVHSWAMSSAMWAYQVAHLSDQDFRCIAFDRRGHGRSDIPYSGYDIDTLADDLAAVIEGLHLEDVVLVGHSMGCGEILRYASRHGSRRIAKALFMAPSTPMLLQGPENPAGVPAEFVEQMRAAWRTDFPRWIDQNKAAFFTPETSPQMMDWLIGQMLETPLPVVLATNKSLAEADFRPDLAGFDKPVLVLHGDRDMSAPLDNMGRRTAEGIGGAVLKVLPGAPHGLMITHMEAVNEALLAFARG